MRRHWAEKVQAKENLTSICLSIYGVGCHKDDEDKPCTATKDEVTEE
jgi:hypothetical protein